MFSLFDLLSALLFMNSRPQFGVFEALSLLEMKARPVQTGDVEINMFS